MVLLNDELVSELKAKVNIVDIISQYVALAKNGNRYLGLCPFHGEKTPSFNVNAQKGFYHCFGCGKSGDVIEFLKEYKQIGFKDAVAELAEFAGVTLDLPSNQAKRENPNQPLYEINNQAARLYNIVLMSTELGEQARAYLSERGISDDIIKRFNLGLAPDTDDFIYQNLSKKFEENVLANSGLFHFSNAKVFDAFSNRIMFPICNEFGQTIGFSGRRWQEGDTSKGKYVNTTQTPIFDKSYELWNFDKAKAVIARSHEVYLMEGFMDVIAAYKAGIMNVVASMGTAFTEKHVRRLKQTVKNFVLLFDGDSAGQNAIYKAMDLIGENQVSVVRVPEKLDPDEYLKAYGPEELARLMQQGRIQPLEFLIDYLKPENLNNLQAQVDFIEQMAPRIAQVKSITLQDALIRKLVEILPDFEYNQVEEAVNLRRENVRRQADFGGENLAMDSNLPDADFAPPQVSDEAFLASFESGFPPENAVTGHRNSVTTDRDRNRSSDYQKQVELPSLQAKLSQTELAEQQLLNRMIEHPAVLRRFEADESFHFVHARYQELFELVMLEAMTYGRIDAMRFAGSLSDEAQRGLFYEVIGLDLPQEVGPHEIEDLLSRMEIEQQINQLADLFKQLEVAKKAGNQERELELTIQIIGLKKKL